MCLISLTLSACGHFHRNEPVPALSPRPAQIQLENVYSKPLPSNLRRIAMLPIYSTHGIGAAQRDMDEIFRGELGKMLSFEIVPVSRAELASLIQREQFSSTEMVPPEMLRTLQEKYAVEGVLFTEFTQYRPYRPISIGVRSKLVELNTFETVWSVDNTLDSSDPRIVEAALRYVGQDPDQTVAPGSELIFQSPRRYAAFVAHQVYSTLPGR